MAQRNDPSEERKATLLLIEDSIAEQRLLQRALKKGNIDCDLRICNDGVEALDYLHQRGPFDGGAEAPRPDLILLDLNMPRVGGLEVLKNVKESPALASIPIIVLTTSKRDEDMVESYQLGCASFVSKPVDIKQFIEVVSIIGNYWFQIVRLPSPEEEEE